MIDANTTNQQINLIFAGEEQKAPLASFGPLARTNYIIHYVLSGTGYVTINGTTHTIGAGECFLFYPYDYVYYWADKYSPWHYVWIDFNGALCETLLNKTAFSRDNFILKPCPINVLYPKFLNALNAVESQDEQEIKNAALYNILAQLIKLFPKNPNRSVVNNKLALNIYRHVNLFFMNKTISVNSLCQMFNISRAQLFRYFKTEFNVTPIAYISNLRFQQAKILLKKTDHSVSTIASMVGFNDALYFSRIFTKKMGIPPTEYRKRFSSEQDETDTSLYPPLKKTLSERLKRSNAKHCTPHTRLYGQKKIAKSFAIFFCLSNGKPRLICGLFFLQESRMHPTQP